MPEYVNHVVGAIVLGASILIVIAVGWLGVTARRIERKVDAFLRHSHIDIGEVALAEAQEQLAAGKKIGAIRIYREYTGCSLAEAKAKIESLHHRA